MRRAYKVAAKDSCNFALNKGNSNETNIKITPEIAALFGIVPNPGDSFDVSFYISKEDYIMSLCRIMDALPLFNSKGKLIRFSDTLFYEMMNAIDNFFGSDNVKEIKAKLTKPGSHPICLNFGSNNFCIRDFLVESRSVLAFVESEGKVRLNVEYKNDIEEQSKQEENDSVRYPLQQIFYGAPGTGKSYTINEATKNQNVVRTTFHPDSDYSTFVGAYKPTTLEVPVTTIIGMQAVPVKDTNNIPIVESKIVYEYVPQAFLQAYVNAWKLKNSTASNEVTSPQFLVVEEINRGNCAQIFGDLFQLLDRNAHGFSCYPIKADKDIQKFIAKEFKDESFNTSLASEFPQYCGDIVQDITNGEVMVLPDNFYIWATMNTSDQSLFPIDSAFKRRWDWKYIPINTQQANWSISTPNGDFLWSSFLEKINAQIAETTSSEDKKLGFYFCKAVNEEIDTEMFVGKVLFYIYDDIFKDYVLDLPIFKGLNDEPMTFQSYYNMDGSINDENVVRFLRNLGVKSFTDDLPLSEEVLLES